MSLLYDIHKCTCFNFRLTSIKNATKILLQPQINVYIMFDVAKSLILTQTLRREQFHVKVTYILFFIISRTNDLIMLHNLRVRERASLTTATQ